MPVLDVRPVTLGMISTTTDPAMARNAISFRGDTGISFADASVPNPRRTPAHLRYATGGYLADGVLFIADQMEHKWAVFFHRDRLLFVRSWLRELHVAAQVRRSDGYVEIEQIEGVFTSVDEPPALTEAIMDFIVRSHVLGLVHPAPLAIVVGDDLDGAGLWCFSMFGNLAWVRDPRAPGPGSPPIRCCVPTRSCTSRSCAMIAPWRGLSSSTRESRSISGPETVRARSIGH